MDLLTIHHQDFTMYVECTKFDGIWNKAKRNVGEENLLSAYTWSEGVESVDVNSRQLTTSGEQAPAIFFDNTDYPIWVEFKKHVDKAQFGSELQNDNDLFSFRDHTLAGYINYGNDIGKSELNIVYQVGTDKRHFTLGYEVLSTKLNYHEHWKKIVEDIEEEYRMLSLDYMRRTFHGFTPDAQGETQEIIWWSVFKGEQKKFIKACRNIIERPRHRLRGYEVYLRADKLKRVPSNIENELAEHRKEPAHLYRVEEQIQSNDTQENRFLKYALGQITAKYELLKKRIEAIKNTSDVMKKEMDEMLGTLKHLQRNPFFRTVGRFKGLNQESLVLQLTKDDMQKGMKMTYLFDAKYRIADKVNRVDTPPDDAINQMHRYRDAIYYKDYPSDVLKKEVIGGYILFPGDGEPADVEVAKFYKTIGEVNIGAFPLRPKDERNRTLLEKFIKELIETKSSTTVTKVIPQKGVFVEVGDRVLIGLVKPSNRKGYYEDFENGCAQLYYTGAKFPSTIALHNLHFFIPYFKGTGIREVYEIKGIQTIWGSVVKQLEGVDEVNDDIRLAFTLSFHHKLTDDYQMISTVGMINNTFINTTFEELENLYHG